MSDPTQQCPGNLALLSSPVRGCYRSSSTCNSAFFQPGRTYTKVCGRINAYQYGTTDAFYESIVNTRTIEQVYMGGVALTHGQPGSRQHIWSFAAAISELAIGQKRSQRCACTDPTSWPYTTPSLVGNDYFCETGNLGNWRYGVYYTENPMWDGTGCGPSSTCCEFNNPPWFCKTLPQAASDQVELRICGAHGNERTIVYLAEIFVQ